jgi:hypothetical protein
MLNRAHKGLSPRSTLRCTLPRSGNINRHYNRSRLNEACVRFGYIYIGRHRLAIQTPLRARATTKSGTIFRGRGKLQAHANRNLHQTTKHAILSAKDANLLAILQSIWRAYIPRGKSTPSSFRLTQQETLELLLRSLLPSSYNGRNYSCVRCRVLIITSKNICGRNILPVGARVFPNCWRTACWRTVGARPVGALLAHKLLAHGLLAHGLLAQLVS